MLSRAFGLSLDFETPPPGGWEGRPEGGPALRVRDAGLEEIAADWSGREALGWEATIEGAPFSVERGRAGDHRFSHGEESVQLLSADGEVLRCAWAGDEGLERWRVVLDSVLFSVSLLRGFEALHAGAVATKAGAIAITAGAGGGKSTLLATLLGDGYSLFSDDVVALESRGEAAPLAHPGPPLMTVPAGIDPLPGESIAALEEERWIATQVAPEAIPLNGLVLLNRAPGLPTRLSSVESPLPLLLGSLLSFPRSAERERTRFELAAAIATHVPVWELSAEPTVEPARLAELLQEGPLDRG